VEPPKNSNPAKHNNPLLSFVATVIEDALVHLIHALIAALTEHQDPKDPTCNLRLSYRRLGHTLAAATRAKLQNNPHHAYLELTGPPRQPNKQHLNDADPTD